MGGLTNLSEISFTGNNSQALYVSSVSLPQNPPDFDYSLPNFNENATVQLNLIGNTDIHRPLVIGEISPNDHLVIKVYLVDQNGIDFVYEFTKHELDNNSVRISYDTAHIDADSKLEIRGENIINDEIKTLLELNIFDFYAPREGSPNAGNWEGVLPVVDRNNITSYFIYGEDEIYREDNWENYQIEPFLLQEIPFCADVLRESGEEDIEKYQHHNKFTDFLSDCYIEKDNPQKARH